MGDHDHRSLRAIRETAALVAGYLPSTGRPEVGEEEPDPEPEPEPDPEGRCSGGECVLGGFKVRVSYENDGWSWAAAHSADLGDRTAAFWFFEPDNVEVFVKILDGCRINGHHWLYATKLSGQRVSVLVGGERVAVPDEGVKDLSWRPCD